MASALALSRKALHFQDNHDADFIKDWDWAPARFPRVPPSLILEDQPKRATPAKPALVPDRMSQ